MVSAVQWHAGEVRILDQTRLPGEIIFRDCRHYEEVAECIRALRIRGAPAIGIAAAMGVALAAQDIRAQDF
ncbi:MAG: S-methyl-5-thioribose-1-phosphate isomerase, partial [Thermodesulfovibrionales bacterium]